jgi:hypothetical protein
MFPRTSSTASLLRQRRGGTIEHWFYKSASTRDFRKCSERTSRRNHLLKRDGSPRHHASLFWGIGCWVSGVGCRLWGIRYRLWGIGCRLSGIGYRLLLISCPKPEAQYLKPETRYLKPFFDIQHKSVSNSGEDTPPSAPFCLPTT